MLRVGLTGQLGSGKSTVAKMLRARGAHVFSADDIGRELMQPGQGVYAQIVAQFGNRFVRPDGTLDRAMLAQEAFTADRIQELNAIIHPAVIAEQQRRCTALEAAEPNAIAVVESALIFEAERDARLRGDAAVIGWRARFNKLVLVTAPEEQKIARAVARIAPNATQSEQQKLRDDLRARLAVQIPDAEKETQADFIIRNEAGLTELEQQVDQLWQALAKR